MAVSDQNPAEVEARLSQLFNITPQDVGLNSFSSLWSLPGYAGAVYGSMGGGDTGYINLDDSDPDPRQTVINSLKSTAQDPKDYLNWRVAIDATFMAYDKYNFGGANEDFYKNRIAQASKDYVQSGGSAQDLQNTFSTNYQEGSRSNTASYDINGGLWNAIVGVGLAVVLPGVGAAIGSALAEAGIVTTAAEAAAAATAAGATTSEVTAAAAAATSTATQIGTAIASVSVQVAQGVPIQDAVMNAAISTVVQTGSTDVAKQIVAAGTDPAVANAITSVGGSIAKTAASGGSETDILKNAVGALAGSGVTTLTADELGASASRAVGAAVGTAAAGGDTSKVLSAAAGALGNASTTTSTTAANTTALTPEEQAQVAENRITSAVNTAQTSAEQAQPGIDARTQEIINQMQSGTVVDPAVSSVISTADTTAAQTAATPAARDEVVISAPAGGASNVSASDQQILNLIGTDTATTGGANAAVINPATISTTGAGANVADANVASTAATTETPATTEEIVVTPDKPVVPDANVDATIVDTSSKPLIDKETSLANAAGQDSGTVTVTADKPAANVSTGDQQIIDLISGDTSKATDTGAADTGTAVTDAGTVNVTAGRENVAAPTIIDVVSPEPAPAPAPEPAPADKVEEVVVTAKKDNVSPTIIDTVETPAAKTEPVAVDKTAAAEDAVAKDAVPFKPELFIFGGTSPKGQKSSALSQTINAPFYPSTGLTQALTASRPAGEIDADPTGKKRQNVWNEASLRLKDALGI